MKTTILLGLASFALISCDARVNTSAPAPDNVIEKNTTVVTPAAPDKVIEKHTTVVTPAAPSTTEKTTTTTTETKK